METLAILLVVITLGDGQTVSVAVGGEPFPESECIALIRELPDPAAYTGDVAWANYSCASYDEEKLS